MDCEVLVVGGGIIGLAVAAELQARDCEVLLVESDRVGAGQSGGDARIFRHVRQAQRALFGWHVWEKRYSQTFLNATGLIVSGETASHRGQLLRQCGEPVVFTRNSQAVPGSYEGLALWDMAAATIDMPSTLSAFADTLTALHAVP